MTTNTRQHNNHGENLREYFLQLKEDPDNEELQKEIILKYSDLVHAIANKYSKNTVIREDLIQVGMVGLIAAIKRYDPSIGKSFESFAVPTILGEIKRYIRDKTWSVHVPRRIKEAGPKINKAIDKLTMVHQSSPTIKQIADYIGISEEEVLEALEMGQSYHSLSLDKKMDLKSDDAKITILDLVGVREQGYDKVEYKLLIEKLLPVLSEQEQMILHSIYFQNMSQKEVGEILGISQMHVSRLQRRALIKMREMLQSE
jgi:RNA polymerase sigma-B factor